MTEIAYDRSTWLIFATGIDNTETRRERNSVLRLGSFAGLFQVAFEDEYRTFALSKLANFAAWYRGRNLQRVSTIRQSTLSAI